VYLRELTAMLLRRWLLVFTGLLITAGFATFAAFTVPVSYVAHSSLVLLPPAAVVGKGGNPFLYLGGLGQALDVLTRKLNADEFSAPLSAAHRGVEFLVFADTTSSGPILVVESTGPTPASTAALMNEVVSDAPDALTSLQSSLSVPYDSRITMATVAVDREPKVDQKTRIQAVSAIAAAGLIGTVLLAGYRDGRLRARRERDQADEKAVSPTTSGQ
jgi:hypothetical protein